MASPYPYPGYENEAKGPHILGVFWAFYAVSLVVVSARLWIRASMLRNTGLDDYIIAVSMVRSYTYGRDSPALTDERFLRFSWEHILS